MDALIARTLDGLELSDSTRGVWDVLAARLMPTLKGADVAPLLAAAEQAARGVGLSREASMSDLLEGYTRGCEALGQAMDAHKDERVRHAANRLAQLQPTLLRSLASGYAAGLEDTIANLKRQAAAASPVDGCTGAMKPQQIADRLALEVLRCQRMDLSLGVAEMSVEVGGDEAGVCRREDLTETQREVGECLRESLRRYDSIGLTRGGRFLLVLPHVTRRGLASAGERLRREVTGCAREELQLVLALAHYDYVDVGAPDMLATLQRSMDEARDQGKTVTWAA